MSVLAPVSDEKWTQIESGNVMIFLQDNNQSFFFVFFVPFTVEDFKSTPELTVVQYNKSAIHYQQLPMTMASNIMNHSGKRQKKKDKSNFPFASALRQS